ncbi:MAG: tetratricopeptide repeat protein [Saprospiraceae bacterium]|nr:tetratricopeptide repeat protein [Saprospiraceae bacterium]
MKSLAGVIFQLKPNFGTTMKPKLFLGLVFVVTLATGIVAQPTTVFTEANLAYKRGMDFYDKGIYNVAMQEFYIALTQLRPAPEPEARLLRGQAELHYAKAAVRSGQPNGEQLMLDYIRTYSPDPLAGQAAIEMGDFYFNQGKLDKALDFYNAMSASDLPPAQRDELYFKQGYAYFVSKKFPQAKANLSKVRDLTSFKYYNEANYYYGMCAFFENNLDEAARSFQRVASSKQYAAVVPYNLVQIFAAQRDWDKVLRAGLAALEDPKIKNAKQINQLIGQAYFEKKQFELAEKYLVEGADGNASMRAEDYYQLGFCQHRNGHYDQASKSLENLSGQNSQIGQHGMYLLGDCYLRLGNRPRAKNAFSIASRMNYDPSVTEEAQWNYAKLAYELKQTQEAVDALQAIPQSSKNYSEAQNLLSEVLLQTRNFDEALRIINATTYKTPKLREAAQKALTYRGMQLVQTGDKQAAKTYFERSLTDAPDATTKMMANYWLGYISYDLKEYDNSQRYMGNFLSAAKGMSQLPAESSIHMANYIQGYNYLKEKNYQTALTYFQDCVTGIKREFESISSDYVRNQVLGDATLRLGDCHFKRNQYDNALRFYDEAVNKNYSGFVYALYQKGIIQGLKGNNVEKLISLEKLTTNYPNSEFAAAALLEIGITYMNINQLDKAQQALSRVVQNHKDKNEYVVGALLRLGLIAQNKGNNESAISYYKQVFYNNPSPTDAKAALERLQDIYVNELGKPDEYFAFLQTIPGYKVDNLEQDNITYKAAEVQYEAGNYDKAILNFTSYLSRFPNSANTINAYYYRGESYAAKKDYANALSDYDAVVQRGSSKLYEKACEKATLIAYNSSQNFSKAFDLAVKWDKVASTEDKRFEAELWAARSAYRLNRADAVLEYGSKVANSNRATKVQIAQANFQLGKVTFDRNEWDRAQGYFLKTIAAGGSDEQTSEARYLDAMIEYKKRNLDAALDKADRASMNNPSVYWAAKAVILQADIYAEKNDLVNARAALESIVEGVKEYPEIVTEAQQKLNNLKSKESVKSRISNPNNNLIEMDKDN